MSMTNPPIYTSWRNLERGQHLAVAGVFDDIHMTNAEAILSLQLENSKLRQRLTAADELNDNRDSEIFAQVQSALRRSFSLGQIYWQQADSDSTCQQNKSDQTMEVQEQHILNVLKSVGTALKPAEARARIQRHECSICKGQGLRVMGGEMTECPSCDGEGFKP